MGCFDANSRWVSEAFVGATCLHSALHAITRYPKIRAVSSPALAGRLVNRLRDVGMVIDDVPLVDWATGPDDNYLLALAEVGCVSGATVYGL